MDEKLLQDYQDSKRRLNDLAQRHFQALAYAHALKVQWDDAQAQAMRIQEQLQAENEKYMELEKRVEAEKGE